MSEANKAILQQYIDAYNQGAWDRLESLVSTDYIHHNNSSNLNIIQFKRGASWFRTGMPDFHIVVEDMVTEADKIVVRFTGHGTHLGSFFGETPTSNTVIVYGTTIYRIENSLIQEDWEALDEQYFMNQIGAPVQGK